MLAGSIDSIELSALWEAEVDYWRQYALEFEIVSAESNFLRHAESIE